MDFYHLQGAVAGAESDGETSSWGTATLHGVR